MSVLEGRGAVEPDLVPPLQETSARFAQVVRAVADVVLVERRVVELAAAALVAEGHLLIEDRPGLGKTTMAKALAAATGLSFRRVQCTADLLPSDVTGALVPDLATGHPAFRPGPIFANVVMADELNRASARSQSAFLEAMGEGQVTVDGVRHRLPRPFVVLATQNPFDDAGTGPLPHSQRDRFLLRLSLGYPGRADEERLLLEGDRSALVDGVSSIGTDGLAELAAAARRIHVAPALAGYVADLLDATRRHPSVAVGASPRAGLAVMRTAAALAVGRGRGYVAPDDVQEVAGPALAHRLLLTPEAALEGTEALEVVDDVLDTVAVIAPDRPASD